MMNVEHTYPRYQTLRNNLAPKRALRAGVLQRTRNRPRQLDGRDKLDRNRVSPGILQQSIFFGKGVLVILKFNLYA